MNVPLHTVQHLLAERAATAAPMLIDRGRPIGFHALAEESRRIANGLQRMGVRPGDRIALWLPNVPAWLATFFACAQLGAIAVSVNTRFRSHEVADILARSGARMLILWPGFKGIDFASILAQCDPAALDQLESIVVYSEDGTPVPKAMIGKPAIGYETLASGAASLESAAAPGAGCVIFTTSGTTSAPKFVLHDQRSVAGHARNVARGFGLDGDSAMLLSPPLCGVYGFCSAMAALAAGRPLVMRPAWDAAQAADDIVKHRVTHANGTDEAIAQLLRQSGSLQPFPAVRFFGYAAFSPAHADIVARADEPRRDRDATCVPDDHRAGVRHRTAHDEAEDLLRPVEARGYAGRVAVLGIAIGMHEDDGAGNVGDVHRRLDHDVAIGLRHAVCHPRGHFGQRVADVDLTAGDVVFAAVHRSRLCETGHRMLGSSVWSGVRPRSVCGDRAVVDDTPALRLLTLHNPERFLSA